MEGKDGLHWRLGAARRSRELAAGGMAAEAMAKGI